MATLAFINYLIKHNIANVNQASYSMTNNVSTVPIKHNRHMKDHSAIIFTRSVDKYYSKPGWLIGFNFKTNELKTYNLHTRNTYCVKIDICKPNQSENVNWINYNFYNKQIIISDYSGITVYNYKLQHILKINILAEDKYKYIYGFNVINNQIYVWIANKLKYNTFNYRDNNNTGNSLVKIYDM